MMERLSYKALMSAILKKSTIGQALYASVLIKQFIVADTIIEVFDNNINFSVKACRAGPDAHKIVYRWFSPWCIWE